MPARLTYPGVYIEEIHSGVRTITGVATFIIAFIDGALAAKMNYPVIRLLNITISVNTASMPKKESMLARWNSPADFTLDHGQVQWTGCQRQVELQPHDAKEGATS